MDISNFPTALETLEDYKKASKYFVLPFLQERAVRIADVLRSLYATVDAGKPLEREDVDFFLNQFREAASFADKDNVLANLYFKNVMALEEKLDENGELTTEEITIET